jgi:hypothetical protein
MTEESKVIIISDLLDTRARKQKELAFYNDQLKELQAKMYWVKKEIDLTTDIINMIEREKMLDLKKLWVNKSESKE